MNKKSSPNGSFLKSVRRERTVSSSGTICCVFVLCFGSVDGTNLLSFDGPFAEGMPAVFESVTPVFFGATLTVLVCVAMVVLNGTPVVRARPELVALESDRVVCVTAWATLGLAILGMRVCIIFPVRGFDEAVVTDDREGPDLDGIAERVSVDLECNDSTLTVIDV